MRGTDDRAARLAEARRQGRVLAAFPGDPPPTLEEALALQDAVDLAMGEAPAGWKIGATSAAIQAAIGTAEPFPGRLYAPRCHASGARLELPEGTLGIECEFAFRMARTLPPRPSGHAPDEVAAAIGSVHPAIELVGQRLPRALFRDVRSCVADHGLNVAFVAGEGFPWAPRAGGSGLDLAAARVRAVVNGEERASGTGAAALGDPLAALVWLSNFLGRRGRGVEAGEWVSTGTCTGVVEVAPGDVVEAAFEGLGTVVARF